MKQYYYYYTPLMDPCRNPANDVIRKPFKMTVIKGPHFFRSMQILFGVENEFCASCRVPYLGVLKTRDPCPTYVGLLKVLLMNFRSECHCRSTHSNANRGG